MFSDDTQHSVLSVCMQSHVAADGVLHIVAEPDGLAGTLAMFDLPQARILRSLARFWGFRIQ